jgi:hypothetical protein
VPLGSLAFSLPFVPGHQAARGTDVVGLCVILGGLLCYRFGVDLVRKCGKRRAFNHDLLASAHSESLEDSD